MGKTSKPLTFVIESSIDGPTFDALRAQGHTIYTERVFKELDNDLALQEIMGYFGPKCWRMDKRVADDPKLFEVALKSMREMYYHGVEHPKTSKAKTSEAVTKPAAAGKPRRRATATTPESDSGVGEVPREGTDDTGQTSLFAGDEKDT